VRAYLLNRGRAARTASGAQHAVFFYIVDRTAAGCGQGSTLIAGVQQMNRWIGLVVVIAAVATGTGAAVVQHGSDRRAIERVVLDYVDALYEVKPELVDRAVHPAMAKRGFVRGSNGDYAELTMSFDQLRTLSETGTPGAV
jgi:hypothetical protein